MRPTLACLFFALPLAAADPEKPVELTAAEIAKIHSDREADREEVWKKYDGKLLKLKGLAANDGLALFTPATPKYAARIVLKYADVPASRETREAIQRNSAASRRTEVAVYGRAAFSSLEERVTADYVVPDELKPKKSAGGGFESIQDTSDRLQKAMIEEAARQEKILADARKKGKVEKVKVWGKPPTLADAVFDLRYLPPAK